MKQYKGLHCWTQTRLWSLLDVLFKKNNYEHVSTNLRNGFYLKTLAEKRDTGYI